MEAKNDAAFSEYLLTNYRNNLERLRSMGIKANTAPIFPVLCCKKKMMSSVAQEQICHMKVLDALISRKERLRPITYRR
jgi:hypothetical protein